MSTVTVSIGRNVGREPMSGNDWSDFQSELQGVVTRRNAAVHFAGTGWSGLGGYGEPETERRPAEESYTIVAEFREGHELEFTRGLYDLAAKYQQDCIAVTIGQTAFVGPRPW